MTDGVVRATAPVLFAGSMRMPRLSAASERIRTWLVCHCDALALMVFALAVFILGYHSGVVIDSRHELDLGATSSYSSFFHAWAPDISLGQDSSSSVAYVFPFGFLYWVGESLTTTSITQAAVLTLTLGAGFAGMLQLLRRETPAPFTLRCALALLVVLNPYTLGSLTDGYTVLLLPLMAIPWQLLALRAVVVDGVRAWTGGVAFGLAGLLMGGVNPPLDAINVIVLFFWLLHLRREIRWSKALAKKIAAAAVCFVALNAFWLVGTLLFFSSASTNTVNAILSESIGVQNSRSTYVNSVRGVALWAFGGSNNGEPYYKYGKTYLDSGIFEFFEFVPIGLACIGLVRSRREWRRLLPLTTLLAVSIVMIVATNQGPFASAYRWAYAHVPGFDMFRSNFKFTSVFYLAVALVIALTLSNGPRKSRDLRRLGYFLLAVACLLLASPFWTRQVLNSENVITNEPQAYAQAARFFRADATPYKILLLPDQYFARYTWGQPKGNPEFDWGHDLVVRQAGDPNETGNAEAIAVTQAVLDHSPAAPSLLAKLGIAYIVERDDYDWQYYPNISQPPQTVATALETYPKLADFGPLHVYRSGIAATGVRVSDPAVSETVRRTGASAYTVTLSGLRQATDIILEQSYHPGWRISVAGASALPSHFEADGYANGWRLPTADIPKNGKLTLHISFSPQRRLTVAVGISAVALLACAGFGLWTLVRRRPRAHQESNHQPAG